MSFNFLFFLNNSIDKKAVIADMILYDAKPQSPYHNIMP